ncbi:MAG: phosphatase domain-containing putative toxin, partial [Planctomycetota bacterium]
MWNFSWVVEDAVAGMAMPGREDAVNLVDAGVTAVVSLTGRPAFDPVPDGLTIKHLPVIDMTPPTQEQLLEAVEFIEDVVRDGGRVAVHCVAGIGRTGTVLSALFVARGMDPAD